jgi:DNA-binding response OmpR family regulator
MIVSVTNVGLPRKILVVDDLPAIRNGLKQILEHAGYQVVVAGSFAEGRFALSEAVPDLLISDVRLGEYNGIQLVATTTRAIPAIIITGFPDPVLEAEARRLGADFLIKPVEAATLLALIKRKLEPAADPQAAHNSKRRWTRKPVREELRARVDEAPARILDISYGGLRFELERGQNRPVPHSFQLELPGTGVTVPADLVWTSRCDDHWLCGAALSLRDEPTAVAWHALVDTIA